MFNSTLFGNSIYRQEPSPEVDQAWTDIGVYRTLNSPTLFRQRTLNECLCFNQTVGVILVDEDKALKAGISKGHITTPPEAGGQYYVNVEVFHQLHDYYAKLGENEFVNEDHIVRIHAGEASQSRRPHPAKSK
jgi:hypothetical protein